MHLQKLNGEILVDIAYSTLCLHPNFKFSAANNMIILFKKRSKI
jgi:hypothetical protein